MQLSWSSLRGPVFFIIIIIVLTQLHLIISASISAARAPAGDVTSSWYRGSDVTETTRRTVVSNAEVAESVRSNATASATKVRSRRHLHASQGCGPVCNLCRQVRTTLEQEDHLCCLRLNAMQKCFLHTHTHTRETRPNSRIHESSHCSSLTTYHIRLSGFSSRRPDSLEVVAR